jgi:hypothetical protein
MGNATLHGASRHVVHCKKRLLPAVLAFGEFSINEGSADCRGQLLLHEAVAQLTGKRIEGDCRGIHDFMEVVVRGTDI